MRFLEALSHPLWRVWSETLLHFLWQGAFLGVAAALAINFLRLRMPSQRYALLLTTHLLMVACLPITFAVVASADWVQPASIAVPDDSLFPAVTPSGVEMSRKIATSGAAAVLPSLPEPEVFSLWVVGAWSAGVVVLSLRIFASWVGMRLLVRGRQPVSAALRCAVARLTTQLQLSRIPSVFISPRVVDATVVGFLRPIVLLPAAWVLELSPDLLEAVLAHELAHIRRHDLWINLLQRVVETVLFYHPAVWWVSRRLRAEREMCCDELAVSATHQRLVYVTALESVARRRAGQMKPALAVTLGDQEMALLKRIQHILGFSAVPNGGWCPAALVALALPAGLWFGWTAFAPGTTAVADEGATVANTFKSGMSDYDSNLFIGNLGALQRHRGMFAAATENADEATPAKTEDRDKEERPAPPGDRGPDGPPGPPPGERPAADRPGPTGGYGRGAGLGRRDNDRRADDDQPAYGRVGVPGAAPAAGRERMPTGRLGSSRSRPDEGEDGDSDARTRRPAAAEMRGDRAAGMRGRINSPRGRHGDEDDPGSKNPEATPQDEMVRLLRDLHREVEQLRREVRELREQRRPGPDSNRGADRRGPPSNEDRDDKLRGPEDVDAWGNPVRFYREDRDGNLRRADDEERGTRGLPTLRKSRLFRQRPGGESPAAPGVRSPAPRREAPEDGLRGRDEDDRPAGRPEERPDSPPQVKRGDERPDDAPPRRD